MTDKIEMKNLSVTKINESETETEDGVKTVYTYTLGNEDAPAQFVWKTGENQEIRIGQRFNISMFNPQTQLPLEAEGLANAIDNAGLMDKVVDAIEKHPTLKEKVKDKLDEYHALQGKKDELERKLEQAKKEQQGVDDKKGAEKVAMTKEELKELVKKAKASAKDRPDFEPEPEVTRNKPEAPEQKPEKKSKKKSVLHNNTASEEPKGDLSITINDITLDPAKKPIIEKLAKKAAKAMAEEEKRMSAVNEAKKEKKETKQQPFAFGEPEEPRTLKPKEDKLEKGKEKEKAPKAPETKEKCKFYYRGGLCANSQTEKPFCTDVDKCTFYHPELTVKQAMRKIEDKDQKRFDEKMLRPVNVPDKESLPKVDEQEEIGRNGFLGTTYQYSMGKGEDETIKTIGVVGIDEGFMAVWKSKSGGYHRIKSKALGKRETQEQAQEDLDAFAQRKKLTPEKRPQMEMVGNDELPEELDEKDDESYYDEDGKRKPDYDERYLPQPVDNPDKGKKEVKTRKAPHSYYKGYVLIKKEDYPKDILGGLQEDVKVESNDTGGFLYAHALMQEEAGDKSMSKVLACSKLKELTGMDWSFVTNKLFNCNKEQLNKNRQKEE